MSVHRIRLDKEALLKIPVSQRRLFLAMAHFMNEVSVLLRSVMWSSDLSSDREAVVHGQLATSLFFKRLLAGKLREGWEILQQHYFGDKSIAAVFARHATEHQKESLASLKQYFGRSNLLHDVRNGFAFHYSPSALDDVLPALSDELDIYIEKRGIANTLYYFAEALANHALLESLGAADRGAALAQFHQQVVQVAGYFLRFGQSYMSSVIKEFGLQVWKDPATPVDLGPLASFTEMRFPWFTDASDLPAEDGAD